MLFASYAALGLVHTLNPLASGGAEHDPTKPLNSSNTLPEPSYSQPLQASPSASTSLAALIPKGYGKIIRDSDGNVVRVELNAEDEQQGELLPADVEDGMQDPEVDKEVMTNWVTELGGGKGSGATIVECESASSFHLSF